MSRRRRRFVARNKGRTVLRLSLLLLAPALLGVLVFGLVRLVRGAPRAELVELPFGPEDSYAYTGRGFLYQRGNNLIYEDDTEKKNDYSLSVSSTSGALRLAAGGGLAALYNDSSVLIAGGENPLSFSGTVERVVCGSAHIAVYVRSDTGESIEIFRADGSQSDAIVFEGVSLVSFGVDAADGDTLWTLTLNTAGGAPISTLTTYNLAQGVTNGLMNIHGELIGSVRFTPTSLFLCGTSHIIRYNRSGNSEAYRELCYGYAVEDFSSTASGPLFMCAPQAEESIDHVRLYSLQEGDLSGARIGSVQLPEGSFSAALYNGRLGICTEEALYLYDASGALVSTMEFEIPVERAEKLSESRMLLSDGEKLYTLDIK